LLFLLFNIRFLSNIFAPYDALTIKDLAERVNPEITIATDTADILYSAKEAFISVKDGVVTGLKVVMFIAMAVSITRVAPNIAITVVPVTVLSVGTDLMVDAIIRHF